MTAALDQTGLYPEEQTSCWYNKIEKTKNQKQIVSIFKRLWTIMQNKVQGVEQEVASIVTGEGISEFSNMCFILQVLKLYCL